MYLSPKVEVVCVENALRKLLIFKNFENHMYRRCINSRVSMKLRLRWAYNNNKSSSTFPEIVNYIQSTV